MPLIPLKESEIVLGKPLPWTVMDVGGRIIFEQSRVLDNQPVLTQLFKLGLYRSALEVYMTVKAIVRAVQTDESVSGLITTGIEFIDLGEQERLYLTTVVYQNLLKDTL